jgi:alkylhydroperoxidase/carboxymuconolactone decarboxylase family protein YurZ/ADP-ribose pyrophosphatase YjhB (NUDIX family)
MGSFIAEPGGHRDGVFGFARRDRRVLLVRNPRVAKSGLAAWWDLPGGAARAGEALPEALRREWREETGLQAFVGDLFLVADGAKRRPGGPVLYTWRAFFFEVETTGAPEAGEGIEVAAWVPEEEVERRLDAPYHGPLRAWLAGDGRRYAPIDWTEPAPEILAGARAFAGLRDLQIIATAAAVGDRDLLHAQVVRARAAGTAARRIEETLLQIVPYAGYPRAISAFGVARPLLGEGGPDAAARPESGEAVFDRVYGETSGAVREGLAALHPALAAWTLEHAYGTVLARTADLNLLERELLAVSILTALGGLEDPLLGHMRAAVRLGAGADALAAAIQVVPASVGEDRREDARALLARI